MIEDVIIFGVAILIGFAFGWISREMYAKHLVTTIYQHAAKTRNILNVNVVKSNDSFLIYNADNDAFIVQVKSKEELFDFFQEKYGEVSVMMKKEHFDLFELV